MNNELTFGGFIEAKRKELEITMRGMAEKLGVAPPYMCDIEKDRRYPPEKKLEEIATILRLNEEEKAKMYDLAAKSRENSVSIDIVDYIMDNEMLRVALRKAQANGYGDNDWKKIADKM